MRIKIRKGDKVCVIAGKDKGKTGVIKSVLTKKKKVIVSGVQQMRCFNKRKIMAGGPEVKEMPIDVSNVSHVDPIDQKATRVKIEVRDNKKLLISKRTGEVIRVVVEKLKNKEAEDA